MVEGYVSAFDPDYYVDCGAVLPAGLDFDRTRLVRLNEIALRTGGAQSRCLSAFTIYSHLYEVDFQHVSRHPTRVINPVPTRSVSDLLVASTLGQFPQSEELGYLSNAYRDAFAPEDVEITPDVLWELMLHETTLFPLRLTAYGLDMRRRPSQELVLFVIRAERTLDILDLWNLRALGMNVVPVDFRWTHLRPHIEESIEARLRVRGRRNIMDRVCFLKSRSITDDEFGAFYEAMPRGEGIVRQCWYPRVWDDERRQSDRAERCVVLAGASARRHIAGDDSNVRFPVIEPPFPVSGDMNDEWTNVLSFDDWSSRAPSVSTVFPKQFPGLSKLLRFHDEERVSGEGIVLVGGSAKDTHSLVLPDGVELFRAWLASQGFKAQLSSAGRTALEMTRAMGGVSETSVLANEKLVKLLQRMASTASRTAVYSLVRACVSHEHHVDTLIERGVLRLGLELKCNHCDRKNWFSVGAIARDLTCERCLRSFRFPEAKPPSQSFWSYRTQGPFSVANYGEGSYSVLLALLFLSSFIHAPAMTWTPSLEAEHGGVNLEFDFACWWKRSRSDREPPALVFAECKSFNTFEKSDYVRARRLMQRFPSAFVVLATLRDKLTASEIRGVSALAKQRRAYGPRALNYSPLIVLTGHELFAPGPTRERWSAFADRLPTSADLTAYDTDLRSLAAVTQHLHLGIVEKYGSMRDA